jgi:hypothetical protein
LKEASTRKPVKFEEARKSVLGSNVFNDAMKQYLTSDAFKEYKALFMEQNR